MVRKANPAGDGTPGGVGYQAGSWVTHNSIGRQNLHHSSAPAIEAAFHGVICRAAEVRVDRAGRPFLQFFLRLGEGDDAMFAAIRSRRPDTIARSVEFSPGALVHAEGVLYLNRKINAEGNQTIVLDCLARHLAIIEIGRRAKKATIAAAASPPIDVDPAAAATDSAEVAS